MVGRKCLSWESGTLTAGSEDVVLIPSGLIIDITIALDQGSNYDAISVMLEHVPLKHESPLNQLIRQPIAFPAEEKAFADAVVRAHSAIQSGIELPLSVAQYRVSELLLWLDNMGLHFSPKTKPTTAMRVRAIIGQDIARNWSTPEITARLAINEATLLRGLASEKTTLRHVMTGLRLSRALAMLQFTDDPVSSIAFAVAYESQSGFSSSFRTVSVTRQRQSDFPKLWDRKDI